MCNFARDVPAGVHVHDYRMTGEREGRGGEGMIFTSGSDHSDSEDTQYH